jgi:hypothetical protein
MIVGRDAAAIDECCSGDESVGKLVVVDCHTRK